MAVKPQAIHLECQQCGWTTCYAPSSDALVELPPSVCEKCQSTDLKRTPASFLESALSALASLAKHK